MIIHCSIVNGQKFSVEGHVYALGKPLPLANISINNNSFGTTSDLNGKYLVDNLPTGNYEIKISYIGFKTLYKKIKIINQIPTCYHVHARVRRPDVIEFAHSKGI